MKRKIILISLLLFIFLTGCQQADLVEQSEKSNGNQENDPYPEPVAYIAPEEPPLEPYVFRISKEGAVTIHGILAVTDPGQSMPDPNDAIFLVPLPDNEGVTMMPTFEIGTVPQADVDERTGEFVFTDIEPGQYVVMVFTIANAKIPARTQEGSFAIIKVTEENLDQTIEVDYLLFP